MADQEITQDIWLKRARDAYSGSTDYFNSNIRNQIEANLRQVQGKHAASSKYNSESYRARSRLFRPKTRTMVRKNEAIAAKALFSNEDVVSITAENDADPMHQASSEITKELVQYRLTNSIPWFQLAMGAYQDAQTTGVVISHQYWKYDPIRGIDKPCIELIPIENFRFDPAADWTDPINSSPYLVWLIPMYYKDVKARMTRQDEKTGKAKWNFIADGDILAASKQSNDSIRSQRQGNSRSDPTDNNTDISEYKIIWVHHNVVEVDGVDFIYYTLGTEHVLSEPVPLSDNYWHNERPFAMGCAVIEAHKVYQTAPVELVHELQVEINEIANQRIDNVKFAMNKRYFAKRGAQVDIRSLTRNVPSSVTLMNSIDDVKVIETNDVTSSSYQEQDRLNLDFDDLAGAFNGSSVQANRKLNETVGGMNLLSDSANEVSEYQLRTFVETWVEPVLKQIVKLEQYYESDENILIFAGTKAKLFEKFGINEITDHLLQQNMLVRVNVGVGSTNPQAQFERFVAGMNALAEIVMSGIGDRINIEEVTKEVFGKLGYKDGARFFNGDDQDPRIAQLEQKLQELQAALDAKLDPQIRDATVTKLLAEADAIKAGTVNKNVDSQFSAMQAGQTVAQMPTIAPVADEILKGAGFTPLAGDGVQASDVPAGAPQQAALLDMPQNTSPLHPANPNVGMMDGMETQANDSVQSLKEGGMVEGVSPTTTADNIPVMATAEEGVLNVEAMALLGEDTLNTLNELGLMIRQMQGGEEAQQVEGVQHLADGGIVQSIKDGFHELMTGAKARAEEQRQQAVQSATEAVTTPPIKKLHNAFSGTPEADPNQDDKRK